MSTHLSSATTWEYEPNEQCGSGEHHPHNCYCPDPDRCCGILTPVLRCCLDSEPWPCETKRAHLATRTAQ